MISTLHNLKDESISLQRKHYYLKDTIIVISSKIQHKASFNNLDNQFILGCNTNYISIIKNKPVTNNPHPIYSAAFYIHMFENTKQNNNFTYILDSNFQLSIKNIPINAKMIELYSKYDKNYLTNLSLNDYPYRFFWPCFTAKINGYIL